MKFNDAIWGVVLIVFAGALFVHVQGFPAMTGQRIGPAVMPGALAVGLGICGAGLLLRGLRARVAGGTGARWVEWPAWVAAPPQALGFAVLVGVNLFYLLAVQWLGFILAGVVYLAALLAVLRVRPARVLPIAIVMTLLIHYCFYKLLKVPLPWGVLQPVAW